MKSRGYISNELVHWTGRNQTNETAFTILNIICEEKTLRLSYCPNYVSDDYNPKTAMVCFTDIPLRYSKEHTKMFGKFGIALKKSNMINYGANPALYTTKKHFEKIRNISTLLERMKDLDKDREWKEDFESYQFTSDETIAIQEISDFLQEYSYKNDDKKDYVTYYQREWRLTYKSLIYENNGKYEHPKLRDAIYIRDGQTYSIFKFENMDIEYIIVPFKWYRKAKKIAKKIGCKLKIYEFCVRN